MISVYLYDFLFVVGLLAYKEVMKYVQDTHLDIFKEIRNAAFWVEYSYIVAAFLFMPVHTATEAAVSFAACMLTRLVATIVLPENYRP